MKKLKSFSFGQLLAKLGFHPAYWEDVSDEPAVHDLVGRRFELRTQLFLVNMGGVYCLEPPGRFEGVPASIEDYLKHPNDWWLTEDYRKAIAPLQPNPEYVHPILGIALAGTKLKIIKATYRASGVFDGRLTVFARLNDPRYSDYEVCCGTILQGLVGENPSPEPRLHLIKAVP